MSEKTIVADLPEMTAANCSRFEQEGGIWGKQYAVRRQQVQAMVVTAGATVVGGALFARVVRRNTWLVVAGTFPIFGISGLALGNVVGVSLYPSVAENKETTMMRRTWWAKECAKHWDMSQIEGGMWKAKYPHVAVPTN